MKAETTILRTNKGAVLVPAAPEDCSYVLIVDSSDNEIAYWDKQEWIDAPCEVMGAIMGAIKSIQ